MVLQAFVGAMVLGLSISLPILLLAAQISTSFFEENWN